MNDKCQTYGSTATIDNGSACAQCGCDREDLRPSDAAACSLPPYDEWRKLPPDDAARILAKARGLDAEQEGLIAAILEHFREENARALAQPGAQDSPNTTNNL